MPQTWFDVEYRGEGIHGVGHANSTPLRRPEAERLAADCRRRGYPVEIVPTADRLWEEAYGDKEAP